MEDITKEFERKLPKKVVEDALKEAKEKGCTKEQFKKIMELLKDQYDAAKITPGESIGIVTAESFGEPSTQMSIAGDEKIIIKIQDKIKIVKIREYIDAVMEKEGFLKFNNSEVLNIESADIYVPSIDQDEKVQWKKVVECSRHLTAKPLIKIRTASGREIRATDNHSFVIRKNNQIVPIKGASLMEGDRLPVIKYIPLPGIQKEINVGQYMNIPTEEVMMNGTVMLRKIKARKAIAAAMPLDSTTGWFIGAYLAEGNANDGQVGISNVNERYIENTKQFVKRVGLDYKDKKSEGEFGESRTLIISSSMLAKFIINNCGHHADGKKVPEFAYNAPESFITNLLRGYFDGDGNVTVERKMIRVSSNAEELLDGVKLLLAACNIFARKQRDQKQYYLTISYKYAGRFLEKIGSDIAYKKKSLERLAEDAKKNMSKSYRDYIEMIGGFDNILRDISKKLGLQTRYVNSATKRQKIGKIALERHIERFTKVAQEKKIDIAQEMSVLARMRDADVVWDEITNIEYTKNEDRYVYDLSVPGLETFTTFDGIVTHNTLNVFHFAGVAEVSVTQGLPRLIEILDARKEIKTPSMEIYIRKEWNKDIKSVKRIAASIKETKFSDIVTEFMINLGKLQVEAVLHEGRMKDLKLTADEVAKTLRKAFKNINVTSSANKITMKCEEVENELLETYKMKEKAKQVFIKGVKGINQVLPVKKENEFFILTAGSNLEDVMQIEEVDESKTRTNDLFEVFDVLGVEAARRTIIDEVKKVIEDQGLDVDIRHIMLIADIMTNAGNVKGITRSGITGGKRSVLARASFETPMAHIINASFIGEQDELNSVIENVMLNQPVPLGTGLPGLVAKMKRSSSLKKGEEKEKEKR